MIMTTYSHAYSFSFAVPGSTHPNGEDLTAGQLRAAMVKRLSDMIHDMSDEELVMACGRPEATMPSDAAPNVTAHPDSEARRLYAGEYAKLAFWAELANQYPECKTGDFPPDAHVAFEEAAKQAVAVWLEYNFPESDHENDHAAQP